ncbi:hypothetical protein [Nocardia farcinica]|uniref:hypothetical protein n=1 Tax=Nocardia farcinica TaxID=37329 RepID=UPI0009D51B41|nr:hypothetical protein [Nocardia farcinica]MBA4857165.1 hypothetical protein [Nocardia farcinica]MBC9818741.1 hypothetical protein [Nocardia farcinica]MBF6072177.1 hypothetical protein [Nocardia farcinica]SLH06934.1 Uncharacterised protein [Mycobacteroides abscessus subsp. abscessus]
MTDFQVCPAALRTQANEIGQCASHYTSSSKHIGEHRMAPLTLGALGKDVVTIFNDVTLDVSTKLAKSAETIQSAAEGIAACATHYENLDADYYRQFGYIDEKLGY